MNKIKRIVSLALVLCMVVAFLPAGVSAAGDASYAYNIVHVDAGRKYFSPAELKSIIDTAAESGYNQVQLYLSDNQGFRFALDDMSLTTAYGTYDLTPALGDGYSDNSGKAPDGTGKYLTEAEMDDIIAYANGKGIDIVPCVNVPGHMGAILEAFTSFRYKKNNSTSKSSIDLGNAEAVAFALGLTEKYAAYFAARGCRFYNVGADEYANDLSSMGFEGMGSSMYTKFVQFLNDAAEIIKELGMTPRAFNDGFYYKDYSISVEPDKAYEVCYWSSGWSGYDVAAASTIAAKGHKMINTNGDYYWVLGNSSWQCSAYKARQFSVTAFQGSTVSNPAGAMFCIWCDNAAADSAANLIAQTESVIEAFGSALPAVESLVTVPEQPTEPTEPELGVETDDATGIIVAGPGLTDLTVTEAEAPAISNAAAVLAWDIVPETAEGPYTGEAEVSIPVPEDMHIAWLGAFVVNNDGTVQLLEGGYANGMYTYTCPHFSVTGIYGVDPTAEEPDEPVEPEERTITLGVGTSATDTITGGEYAADKSDLDESIATVSVTTTPAQEAAVSYNNAGNIRLSALLNANAEKQATIYYVLADDGNYYPLYVTRTSETSGNWWNQTTTYTYTWFYSDDGGASFTQYGTQSETSTNTNANITLYTKSGTEAVEASTTVTFRGVSKGTTYVTVGNVRYTINVTDAPPSNAVTGSSLTLEYWITNLRVTCSGATSATIRTSTAGVNTEEGVALATIAGATGTWDYGDVVYWKSVRLDSDNQQTTGAGDDETADGTIMTHVRYYSGAWQYKTADGVWNYFVSGDQLVAYYLMPTDVTDQITTLTKDWGYDPATNTDGPADGQVALSFAVVDGSTLTPSEENIFSTSTTIFNYWSGRDIGVVAPVSNENYEVYKITVTAGKRSSGTSGRNSPWKSGAPVWEKTTNDLGTGEWFDEREVWNISEGTDPMVNGQLDNVVWTAKDTAFLILFYVRTKNADLTVRYVDDSLAGATITERGVFANADESFYNLVQTSPVPDADGSFTLDDNASLTYYNYETEKNVVQTFEKSLLNFQDIQPQYRSGAYEYVGAELANDGKTLILHYNINDTVLKPRFVVDFGLSVSVPMTDIVANYGTADVTNVQVMNAAYGTATIANGYLTYVPNAVLQSAAAVTLRITNSNGTYTIFNVGFVPASTMYYEEGFAAFTGSWTGGSTGSGEQALQDSKDDSANYGYDAKYAAETGMSGGTEAVSTASGDKAELSFTGTGIDVYANCDTDTSAAAVLLYQGDKLVKVFQVDTEARNGTTGTTDGQAEESVSLPVVSIQGLTHGNYRLVIQHTKKAGTAGDLRIDGYRVYNTLTDEAAANDYPDAEMDPAFLEVRNAVLAGLGVTEQTESSLYTYVTTLMSQVYDNEQTLNGALKLGTDVDVQDLLENGPKNEVFLWPGETLTFSLGSAKAQIGLKAPMGATTYEIADVVSGTVTTGTDLFYSNAAMTGTIVIRNTGSNVLSVTKLKLFGAEGLQALTAEDVAYALGVMGLVEGIGQMERPGAPAVNPFADVAEDSFYYDAVLWAVENGITTGADETHFLPDAICQRASVVTFLWRAAGSPEPETTVNPFVDVTEDAFFYKAVLWALEQGITTGVDATHFAPFGECSRAQVVTFLWRANGCPAASAANPFADVAEGQWYTGAVLWAVEKGITNGMSADIFGVENCCNRAQIVTFLYRADSLSK